ncbi:putative oxidoreductase [Burkholderiales bacterium JOSHI_001]|nr:putative oxidoreductase [Burkholderiales bacterium JOSHI_001]
MLPGVLAGAWRLLEWQFSAEQTLRWVEERLDLGVNAFDLADVHGDARVEALFGRALALRPGLRQRLQIVCTAGLRRGNAQLALPTLPDGVADAASVHADVQRLLAALGTGRIDLLLLQWPRPAPDANALDALAALLQSLQRQGRVGAVGASHWPAAALEDLHQRVPLAAHQVACSLLHTTALADGTLARGAALGLAAMAWSPLAGGRLVNGQDDAALAMRTLLDALSRTTGLAPVTLACAWLQGLPGKPRALIGARRPGWVQQALAARAVELGPQVRQALDLAAGLNPAPPAIA